MSEQFHSQNRLSLSREFLKMTISRLLNRTTHWARRGSYVHIYEVWKCSELWQIIKWFSLSHWDVILNIVQPPKMLNPIFLRLIASL